jgi:serine protease inhibitor
MRFDHPFIFAIRERSTGVILFLGAIADPSSP